VPLDDGQLRQPAVKAANWWRIAQREARLAVLQRLDLPDALAATPWEQIGPGMRDSIARETVGRQ